jgi:23S rRNA (guanosine2251-2'-O)-methyltransferase
MLEELNRLDPDSFKELDKIPVVVVLDSIRSAMNVGSIFRTSDAFAIKEIIICGYTATPPHKEITKTAIGAQDSVAWRYIEDIVAATLELQQNGYEIILVEQTDNSVNLNHFVIDKNSKYALILGNEVDGVSDDLLPIANHALEIKQYGTKHSLNVSVCAGIVIHFFCKSFQS